MKVGDKVRIKNIKEFTGDQVAFYMKVAKPDELYEIEHITVAGDVYLKGITNYFRMSSLEVVM